MEPVQPGPRRSVIHGSMAEAERRELAKRKDAVLTFRDSRNLQIHGGWVAFSTICRAFSTNPARVDGRALRGSAFCDSFATTQCPGWDSNPHAPRGKGF